MNVNVCENENCFICKNITSDWLELFRTKRAVKQFKKNDLIFREGDDVKGVYVILSGKVKIDMSWGSKKHILRLASDGDLLGHRGFGIYETYQINATALAPTTVCFVDTGFFKTLLKTNHDLLWKLNFFFAEELQRSEQKMKNMANMPVKCRVASGLIEIKDAFGLEEDGTLKFSMSRKDMAAMTGSTYETVIRMLNELVNEGFIEMSGKTIKIKDNKGLVKCCKG